MIPSSSCVALVKQSEGLRLSVYRDAAGHATIGYGHKIGQHEDFSKGITEDEAEGLLLADLSFAGKCVSALVTVDLTQGQYDALCDFVFNLGPQRLKDSTLLKFLNSGNYLAVPDELERWTHVGERVLPGLVERRKAEASLWLSVS